MTTIDQLIAKYIGEIHIGEWPIGNFILCAIAILLSVVLCGAIGIERERRGRSAGLRTHLLVGVGSCLIMIISIYGFPEGVGKDRDVARLAAQVIAGVGFLGAGAIIHRNAGIRGLTTAATIWIVMAIGLACGSMNFILAVTGTVTILLVLTLFRKFETRINKKAPLIVLRAKEDSACIAKLLEVASQFECHVSDLHVELTEDKGMEATFNAVGPSDSFPLHEFVLMLKTIDGVTDVSVLNGHKL